MARAYDLLDLLRDLNILKDEMEGLFDLETFLKLRPVQQNKLLYKARQSLNLITVKGNLWLRNKVIEKEFVKRYDELVEQLTKLGYETEHLRPKTEQETKGIIQRLKDGLFGTKRNIYEALTQRFQFLKNIDKALSGRDLSVFKPRQTLLAIPRPKYAKDEKTGALTLTRDFRDTLGKVQGLIKDHLDGARDFRDTKNKLVGVLNERYPSGVVYYPVQPKPGLGIKPYIRKESVAIYAERWVRDSESMAEMAALNATAEAAGVDLVVRRNHNLSTLSEEHRPFVGKVYSLSGRDKDFPPAEALPSRPNCNCYYAFASEFLIKKWRGKYSSLSQIGSAA